MPPPNNLLAVPKNVFRLIRFLGKLGQTTSILAVIAFKIIVAELLDLIVISPSNNSENADICRQRLFHSAIFCAYLCGIRETEDAGCFKGHLRPKTKLTSNDRA